MVTNEQIELATERLNDAQRNVQVAVIQLNQAKRALNLAEVSALLSDKIDGKNEAIRKAQLEHLTLAESYTVSDAEDNLEIARLEYNLAYNEIRKIKLLLRLEEFNEEN